MYVFKHTSKTSKKTFALNSQGLFRFHTLPVQMKYSYMLFFYFDTAPTETNIQQNTKHKKAIPVIPTAAEYESAHGLL